MKSTLKLFILSLLLVLTSCFRSNEHKYYEEYDVLDIVESRDVWYVDYNRTTGIGNVPMLSKAFTVSFQNGRVFANNNIVGIGLTGNGYGRQVGVYNALNNILTINHSLDGYYDFDVIVDTPNSIRLYNPQNNVTYFLEGYSINNFDFDMVFYDNIEYFLQEYNTWEKTLASEEGDPNPFDEENFLRFTPENNTTFESSKDSIGTSLINLIWDYKGLYEVYNVKGNESLKILKLFYEGSTAEEFELTVINDGVIELYHIASGTIYEFSGVDFIQIRRSNQQGRMLKDRQRTKVLRKTIEYRPKSIKVNRKVRTNKL